MPIIRLEDYMKNPTVRQMLNYQFGYYTATPSMTTEFFGKYLRGIGPDSYIVKTYVANPDPSDPPFIRELYRGCEPSEYGSKREVKQNQQMLSVSLDLAYQEAKVAIGNRPTRFYQIRKHKENLIFAKTQEGLIGSGWYDTANTTQKGLIMAGFVLFAIGLLSSEDDSTLFQAVYNYMPYETSFRINEAKEAEKIILSQLVALALSKQKTGS